MSELSTSWKESFSREELEARDPGLTCRFELESSAKDGSLDELKTFVHKPASSAPARGASGSDRAVAEPDFGVPRRPPQSGEPAASPAGAEYEIQEELGRGAMGIVYRAVQRSLDREVAIKVVRPELATEAALARFAKEARVTGLLDHPNIIPIHDLGLGADGQAMLAMKLVEGQSWKARLADPSAAPALVENVRILIQVCHAAAFAHARGIAHLDLKPSNVMVGGFGEVLVMDWGIAVDFRDAEPARATPHRSITRPCGTPSYMAPELAHGRGADFSPATDIYLLGAILYELLEGRPPHAAATMAGCLMAAAESAPLAFTQETPAELQELCRRATARDPEDRLPSATAFREALEDYLAHRESRRTADRAQRRAERCRQVLEEAQAGRTLDQAERDELYADFVEAVAGFGQALALWDKNAVAREGRLGARAAYAEAALRFGDHGLAEAQAAELPADAPGASELKRAIAEARRKAARTRAAARWSLVGAAVAVLAILGGLILLQRLRQSEQEKLIARQELAIAEGARGLAEAEARRSLAEAQRAEAEARQAEAEARRAREVARRREVTLDLKLQVNLSKENEELWPARAENVEELEAWLERARKLAAKRGLHSASLKDLKVGDGTDKAGAEKDGGAKGEEPARFSRPAERWEYEALAELVAKLGALESVQIPEVERRLNRARSLRGHDDSEARELWRTMHPTLKYQEGLIPLGVDPRSKLAEFAVAFTGSVPKRRSDGDLEIKDDTAVILVLLPAGEFLMGAAEDGPQAALVLPREKPAHPVEVASFFMAKYEMTQGQWLEMTGRNPSYYRPGVDRNLAQEITLRHPVEAVSWHSARRVLASLGLSLPTEAQWEYALRAGTSTAWWTGERRQSLAGRENISDKAHQRMDAQEPFEEWLDDGYAVHGPVGSLKPNAYGLYDMGGNLQEWCLDAFEPYSRRLKRAGRPPVKALRERVFRGSAWSRLARDARSTARFHAPPHYLTIAVGLRAARRLR